jgi:hypothetical protein
MRESASSLTGCPLLGKDLKASTREYQSPHIFKKTAEPRTRLRAPCNAVRHSRLRFQLEQNAASAGEVAGIGTKGFVEVEVTASKCRAKDLAVSAEGKHVV